MPKNFWIYFDVLGKCPVLSHKPISVISHPNYVRYVNDRPVAFHGPKQFVCSDLTRTKVWDYLDSEYVLIDNLVEE